MRKLIFLHIEKTAGTSLLRSVLEPNMTCQSLGRLRQDVYLCLKGVPAECLHGHVAYGLHRVIRGEEVSYTTILREPIDRAISYYYFIKGFPRLDLWPRHPDRAYFDSVSIGEVYANPRFSNLQTRRLAGLEFDRTYRIAYRSTRFRAAMLKAAMKHLQEMPVFGLQERFEESQQRILRYVGGGKYVASVREKSTSDRPSVEDIGRLRPHLLDQLRADHELDIRLFEFANRLFDQASPAVQPTA